ncbi:hypothetical protein BAQU_0596 [Bifidobacterium aquikefiri]|uniref:Uncharacterized protein n=1 Tax=Bifidobacterium aquikefiri TaxID=1653207 RepID=A0A261G945_9BIFI|nr:hypothetical protein BAQU_0596 [Bifidobacterium aquikefiri]
MFIVNSSKYQRVFSAYLQRQIARFELWYLVKFTMNAILIDQGGQTAACVRQSWIGWLGNGEEFEQTLPNRL